MTTTLYRIRSLHTFAKEKQQDVDNEDKREYWKGIMDATNELQNYIKQQEQQEQEVGETELQTQVDLILHLAQEKRAVKPSLYWTGVKTAAMLLKEI